MFCRHGKLKVTVNRFVGVNVCQELVRIIEARHRNGSLIVEAGEFAWQMNILGS